jgi:serine phosphatase RsbU (regulator of sigma subunit)
VTSDGIDGRLCLAGHPRPLIRRADGSVMRVGHPGTLLGALTRLSLTDVDFHLDPGDLLLLYTDGLTERLHDDVQFGEVEFHRCVAETIDLTAADAVVRIAGAADAYSRGYSHDDTALLAIQVNPAMIFPSIG